MHNDSTTDGIRDQNISERGTDGSNGNPDGSTASTGTTLGAKDETRSDSPKTKAAPRSKRR